VEFLCDAKLCVLNGRYGKGSNTLLFQRKERQLLTTYAYHMTYYRPPGGGRLYVMVLEKLHDLPRTYIKRFYPMLLFTLELHV
jgi:hypothetical protein